jgi:flagellar biosynthesis/type III secretory pathway protein FliH
MSHDQKLEPDPEQRTKYLDFIDIYADLDDHERTLYTQRYPQEAADMSGFAQRFIEQGIAQGVAQGVKQGIAQGVKLGVQHGEARVLTSQLRLRFGELPAAARQRLDTADADTLLRWSTRVLTAQTLAEVLDDAS